MSKILRRMFVVLAVLALGAGACSSDDDGGDAATEDTGDESSTTEGTIDEGEPVDGGTLVFAVEADSDGYNPIAHRWSISGNLIGSSVYETLVVVTEDGDVEPWLAESIEANDDGTEWTITAREGITFHDGTPFDAQVIADNLTGRKEGALTSLANQPLETVEVVDDLTVHVTMNTPWRAWSHALASQSGYMISETNLGDPAADPIGTGPFTWTEWVPGTRVVVDRYPDYWREGVPHLDRIEFPMITDELTRTESVESGDVDATIVDSPAVVAEYRDTDFTLIEDDESDTHVVMLNSARPPFDNPIAREAVIRATNSEQIVENLAAGAAEVAQGPFASEKWKLDDTGYPGYDPDGAAELVQEYEDETGEPLAFTLTGSAGQANTQRMAALAAQWTEAGMEVEQETVEQAAYIGQVVAGNYEAGIFRNFGWADPDFNFLFWHSSTAKGLDDVSINFTQTKNDELDAALELGRSSDDDDERKQAYDDVQRLLNEEFAYVWMFHSVWGIISQPEVKGWADAEARGFSRQDSKVLWGDLWIEE